MRNTWSVFTKRSEKLPQEAPTFKDLKENQLGTTHGRDSEPKTLEDYHDGHQLLNPQNP